MKDSQEDPVGAVEGAGPGSGLGKSSSNLSQHTRNPIACKYSHSTRKTVAGKSLSTCPTNLISNHKVSQDKVLKSTSQKDSTDDPQGKSNLKNKEIETPSKDAAKMIGSMEICGSQAISQPNFGRADTDMQDVPDEDKSALKYDDPERFGHFSELSNPNTVGGDNLTKSIESEHDREILWAQRSEYAKEIARTIGPDHPSIPTSYNSMEKSRKKYAGGPVDPNGRCKGRKLVLWHRPRMMEKLLLNIQYECFKAKLRIPWDEIVHRLEPGCSGPSAVQMLNKMRDILITEGHMIPPAMGNGIQPDPNVRGYVRDLNSEVPGSTRILRWEEKYPNAPQSLSDSGFIRGSGNYRKIVTKGGAFNRIPRTIEERGYARKVIPEEAYGPAASRTQTAGRDSEKSTSTRPSRGKPRALWKKPGPKIGSKSRSKSLPTSSSQVSPQSGRGDSIYDTTVHPDIDFEYPSLINSNKINGSIYGGTSSDDSDFMAQSKLKCPRRVPTEARSTVETKASIVERENQICETQDGNIVINSSGENLAMVDDDLSVYHSNSLAGHLMDKTNIETSHMNCNEQNLRDKSMQVYLGGYSSERAQDKPYEGLQEHGALQDFAQSLASGTDPSLNGWKYLKLAKESGKIEEGHAMSQNTEKDVSGELVEFPGSDQFLDQFDESKNSEIVTRAFKQQNDMNYWFYQQISSEPQTEQPATTDYLPDTFSNAQTDVYRSPIRDNYYTAEEGNQLHKKSREFEEHEGLNSFNEDILSSPKAINDTLQEYLLSSSGLGFEDTVTYSPKLVTPPRSAISDLFGDLGNLGNDEFQLSSWENEFFNEQEDHLSQIQET